MRRNNERVRASEHILDEKNVELDGSMKNLMKYMK